MEAADRALRDLWNCLCHQGGTSAVGALAVPFLLRIEATGFPGLRAGTLCLVAEIGRCQHLGDGTCEGFFQVAEDPWMVEGETECPVDWTIQAARGAVACDLYRLGGATGGAFGVAVGTVPADDLDSGMGLQPRGQRVSRPIGQHVDGTSGGEVDEDRAVGMATLEREVVHAQHARARGQSRVGKARGSS